MRAALSALLAALAEGAGGDAGLALAEAADGSGRPEALRDWGDRVAELGRRTRRPYRPRPHR
ncbi:hypothetical protein ACGFZQ_19955 [Streptomyces sp. NPDC048254]|uniref:hypothetical protein n=1 Tax=Streptomyces sp. NPDC048254 TaxID=3365525 RepID=UPI00371425C7